LVSKGACFDVVAELHRTEIFGGGVAAARHVAIVGHGLILLRASRLGYRPPSCQRHAAALSVAAEGLAASFNNLVGARQERWRHLDA
jgi:hypothetical protein